MSPDAEKPDPSRAGEATKAHEERVAELFRRDNKKLRKWLCRKAPAEVADEILAQAFTKVLETESGSISHLRAYLYRTASNLRANYYRDKEAHRGKLVLLQLEEPQTALSPESSLSAQQRDEVLNKAIDGLPARCRAALQLYLWESLSIREIVAYFAARGVRVTDRTVQRDIHRGYETCRRALKASEEPRQERSK
jgi:RNA polymerase sigma factor (sigma-70 family)